MCENDFAEWVAHAAHFLFGKIVQEEYSILIMLVKVRVKSEAKKQLIMEVSPHSYAVHVKASQEQGKANKEMIEILQEYFGTKRIKIIKGHTTPHKIVDIFTLV